MQMSYLEWVFNMLVEERERKGENCKIKLTVCWNNKQEPATIWTFRIIYHQSWRVSIYAIVSWLVNTKLELLVNM